jgi:tetratricopeptide (TPR) repeat protein
MNEPSKIEASQSQIGVVGDHAKIEGGIHFHGKPFHPPLQRPPCAVHFTNRETELAQLLADIQPGRVVTLCGPGGIGKTALAAEAVWQLAPGNDPPERFPDGIIFHSFYNQPQADLALEKIALSYGEEPRPTPRDAVQRALAGRQVLLILDGTEEADNLSAVLEARGQCGVLVTSRRRQDTVAERQDLPPLAPEAALKLLQAWGKEQVQDQSSANQICELVGWLPLAVRLVGRYLAATDETVSEYLEWLEKTPLEALDPEGEQRRLQSVPWLLEHSLAQVSETSQQLLAVVGQLALAPFAVEPAAEAMGLAIRATRQLLGELVSYGLLLRSGERYEVSHALIHTYARQRLAILPEASSRLAAYYTALAGEQSALGVEGYRRLDEERTHLMRVSAGRVEREDWEAAKTLAWAVDGYLEIRGYWTERITVLEMGIAAAQAMGDRRAEGEFLGNLGNVHRGLGQYQWAINYYEQALATAQEISNRQGEGFHLGNLGNAYRDLGQVKQAIDYYEQALAIAQEIGDWRSKQGHLGNLGLAYYSLGQYERAIETYNLALTIAQKIGDRRNKGNDLDLLGLAYRNIGQMERAIECHEQALAIAQEIGDRRGEENCLGHLGILYEEMKGSAEHAWEYYVQALVIAREIGDRRGEGFWLNGLATAYCDMGKKKQGIEHYEQALAIAREIGDRRNEANYLGNLGKTYHKLEQTEQAIEYYEKSLPIWREIGERGSEGNTLIQMGNVYSTLGQTDLAFKYYKQVLFIVYREISHCHGEDHHLRNLRSAYPDLEQVEQVKEHLQQLLNIFDMIEFPDTDLVRLVQHWLDQFVSEDYDT